LSTEQENPENPALYEAQVIASHTQWFDPIEIRFIANMTERPLKIGFTHNIRKVEMIGIFDPTEEDLKTETVKALKGEVIEED
jgi:hypothetical protein